MPSTQISPIENLGNTHASNSHNLLLLLHILSLAVEEAQVAIPAQGDDIHQENPVVEWHELEVDDLYEWPDHPVRLQGTLVRAVQLPLRARAFHDGHATEEDEQVGRGEKHLVSSNACDDLGILVPEHDLVLQELEPCGGGRTKDGCASKRVN
jgi:hypothetical protein